MVYEAAREPDGMNAPNNSIETNKRSNIFFIHRGFSGMNGPKVAQNNENRKEDRCG
jgi:hypothetical protein